MNAIEVLKQLKAWGTAQNRKTYGRHGFGRRVYGVSFANIGKLQKKIKTDHDLALKLWASGFAEARVLATMVADPVQTTVSLLDEWAQDVDCRCLAGYVARRASLTAPARQRMEKWSRDDGEWVGSVGWDLCACLAMQDEGLKDEFFLKQLAVIEREIHSCKNCVRYAMNGALIAIGIRNPALQAKALDAAKTIGKVEVDHGETGCKTPDATEYILRAVERKKARAKRG